MSEVHRLPCALRSAVPPTRVPSPPTAPWPNGLVPPHSRRQEFKLYTKCLNGTEAGQAIIASGRHSVRGFGTLQLTYGLLIVQGLESDPLDHHCATSICFSLRPRV